MNELLDDHGLPHAGAPEETRLSSPHVGAEKVDDLDSRLEDLGLRFQLGKRHARAMDGHTLLGVRRSLSVHGFAQQVEHPAEDFLAHGHGDGRSGVHDRAPAGDAVRGIQRDGADPVSPEVLLDLAHQVSLPASDLGVDDQGVADLGKVPLLELRVQDRSDHLDHGSLAACAHVLPPSLPLMISIISFVIWAWRTLL